MVKKLGHLRAPGSLGSQSTYFRRQRGIGPQNEKEHLLGKGWKRPYAPRAPPVTAPYCCPSTTERLYSLFLVLTSDLKRFRLLGLEPIITYTHTPFLYKSRFKLECVVTLPILIPVFFRKYHKHLDQRLAQLKALE